MLSAYTKPTFCAAWVILWTGTMGLVNAFAHSGGLDGQGGHNDRQAGNYHFHQGPLVGKTFSNKDEATQALQVAQSDSLNSADNSNSAADFTSRLPSPLLPTDQQVINHHGFSLQYDEEHEQARWVLYKITAETARGPIDRTDDFRSDPLVTTGSADLSDYRGSGYDRGHMAPAAAMAWSEIAMSESFYLSNISPQNAAFNRGIWRELESKVRSWAVKHGQIWVVTGPILKGDLKKIGDNQVSVPNYYYKVILDELEPNISGIGFVMANSNSDEEINEYAVTIDSVESLSGLNFFPNLEEGIESEVETKISFSHWDLTEPASISSERKTWSEIKATTLFQADR